MSVGVSWAGWKVKSSSKLLVSAVERWDREGGVWELALYPPINVCIWDIPLS